MNKMVEKQAQLEALLFHYGEPIAVGKIAKLLDIKEPECQELIDAWSEELSQNPNRGLSLLRIENKVQLATKPDLQSIFQKLLSGELQEDLSKAALETLTIVSYLGPLPRATIDYIRGVNSSFTVRNLLMRGLIEREKGKSNIYQYRPSFDFLKHMGLNKPQELPDYEKYSNLLKEIETESTAPSS